MLSIEPCTFQMHVYIVNVKATAVNWRGFPLHLCTLAGSSSGRSSQCRGVSIKDQQAKRHQKSSTGDGSDCEIVHRILDKATN